VDLQAAVDGTDDGRLRGQRPAEAGPAAEGRAAGRGLDRVPERLVVADAEDLDPAVRVQAERERADTAADRRPWGPPVTGLLALPDAVVRAAGEDLQLPVCGVAYRHRLTDDRAGEAGPGTPYATHRLDVRPQCTVGAAGEDLQTAVRVADGLPDRRGTQ